MRDLALAPTTAATTHERGDMHHECHRRSNLYGISSSKRLPRVHLEAKDARVRKDLAVAVLAASRTYQLAQGDQDVHQVHERVEDELNDRKHREDEGLRPPMDRIQCLHDLHTTVPKDLRTLTASNSSSISKREWRVGYTNNPHGASRGPLNGMFEPFDAVREACTHLDDRCGNSSSCDSPHRRLVCGTSVAVAYPLATVSPARIASDMQPFDEDAARKAMERKTSVHCNEDATDTNCSDSASRTIEQHHWCPASYSTIRDKGKPLRSASGGANVAAAGTQPFAVRTVATGDHAARKAPVGIDGKCVAQKQSLLAKAAATYARIRRRIDCNKDPKLRYALPIEDAAQQRAYRLGLDAVPSVSSLDPAVTSDTRSLDAVSPVRERLRFRPRSAAGTNVPFRSCASTSALRLSSLESAPSVSKVAGAKRRPTSASVCYLGSSTVYCVNPLSRHESTSESAQYDSTDFASVLDRERNKRRYNQSETLALLTKRGLFHNLPMPQIFARLRREALKNLTRRHQHAQYESLTMDEYMRSCGLTLVAQSESNSVNSSTDASAPVATVIAVPDTNGPVEQPDTSQLRIQADSSVITTSSSLLAMRRQLVVTRQQFHIALEAFSLAPTDVNRLFSALDIDVADSVALYTILCAVEQLQNGHNELRRAHVGVKKRDLPTDLAVLRPSFQLPSGQPVRVSIRLMGRPDS